ncbi:NAD(P)H-dependent oxidoreductase [Spartinivicinus poritis]|uniref:NAD(P)H-dependent oxidoreductase n=1 Tax=Spartinivicinus poritis TaxID=2994640 RepID=A0ABT5UC08_9GAMM|nr:NAD(P)H-dependent oxidoreductase [Spartinivicinus sp. A2-2]MDE1463908.1 NAD(P)H-dependent oxidoreductase [Spartinivicinus sp. A2-2]
MQKVLIINGAEERAIAPGRFNESMLAVAQALLLPKAEVKITRVKDHYQVAEEQNKILWADTIIFQFPVYWFSVPSSLKKYFDEVYAHGLFFGNAKRYGEGGFLTDKRYLLSTTWNAPAEAFSYINGLFEHTTPDDLLASVHFTQQYVGMKKLPSFAAFNIVAQPSVEYWQECWQSHLKMHLLNNYED